MRGCALDNLMAIATYRAEVERARYEDRYADFHAADSMLEKDPFRWPNAPKTVFSLRTTSDGRHPVDEVSLPNIKGRRLDKQIVGGHLGSSVGMPVHGLGNALRKRGLLEAAKNNEDSRRLLEGKTVAVDLSIWVVEGQERSLQIEARGGRIWPNYYLLISLFGTVQFLRYGCFPVGVVESLCPGDVAFPRLA